MSSFIDDVKMSDDTDVSIDPKTYAAQTNPAPASPGVYAGRVTGFDFARRKNGERIVDVRNDKAYPRTVLEYIDIVEPQEDKRKVLLFQQIFSTPFEVSPGRFSSQVGNLVRAFDATRVFSKGSEVFERIHEGMLAKEVIYFRLDWEANDYEWVTQQIEERNLDRERDKAEINQLYSQARCKGFKKFPQINGTYSHLWEGPSGNLIEARPYVSRFFASNEKIPNLGVDKQFSVF